jgi:hypothetical protein
VACTGGAARTGQQRDTTGLADCAHEITGKPLRAEASSAFNLGGSLVSQPRQLDLSLLVLQRGRSVRNDDTKARCSRTGPAAQQHKRPHPPAPVPYKEFQISTSERRRRENSLFDTTLNFTSLFDTGNIFLLYLTPCVNFFPYMTL